MTFRKIIYLGERDYLVYRDGLIEETGADYSGKVRLAILGKKYYFETVKTFPFTNFKDIRAAVMTDIAAHSPFKTDIFLVGKISEAEGKARVNLWFIKPAVAEKLAGLSPWFIIPETTLLSFLSKTIPRIYTVSFGEVDNLLVHVGKDKGVRSLVCRREKPVNIERFCRFIGGNLRDCPVREIKKIEAYLGLLRSALLEMPKKSLLPFLNRSGLGLKIHRKHLRNALAAAAAMVLCYGCWSTLMPYYLQKKLDKENTALSQRLVGLIEKQEMLEACQRKQKELAKKINGYTCKLPLFNLLNRLLPAEAVIRRLTVSGNMVEIRGVAPKASELLASLSQAESIRNAQFTSPLRAERQGGRELFTLTFVYDPEG